MSRLIDADALKDTLLTYFSLEDGGTAMQMAAIRAVDSAPTVAKDINVPGWISVKDRLPGEDGTYLCSREIFPFARFYIIAWFSLERNAFWDYKGNCEVRYITHWMPLPEPPEEEDDD